MSVKTDSGYKEKVEGNCYRVSRRTVEFTDDTPSEEMAAFVEGLQKNWYGQEFDAQLDHVKKVATIRAAVDSSD